MTPHASCQQPVDYGMEREGMGQGTRDILCLDAEGRVCATLLTMHLGLLLAHSVQGQCNVTDFAEAPFAAAVSETQGLSRN